MTTNPTQDDPDARKIANLMLADAPLLCGIDLWFEPDENEGEPRRRYIATDVTPNPQLLKGLTWWVSITVVDKLFADLRLMNQGTTDVEELLIVKQLPPDYAAHYTTLFVQTFLVALVDVTRKLAVTWEPVASIAEELALRILFNEAEYLQELWALDLGPGWRSALEEVLFEDLDHECLYDGLLPVDPQHWFTPHNPYRPASPYARDSPSDDTLRDEYGNDR